MSKKGKNAKSKLAADLGAAGTITAQAGKAVAPNVAAVAVQEIPAKLTKRNATPIGAVLVATDKAPKSRADHVKNAWQAVLAALPSTAAELAKLPALADAKCVSPQAFLSYMQRRGFLTVK